MKQKPVVCIIVDGYGISKETAGNAIKLAKTPVLDYLMQTYPHTQLKASGEFVGLEKYQKSSSVAGHENIGAGRIVKQDLTIINKAIRDGSFFNNDVLLDLIKYVKKKKCTLHLIGLLSDGGVHSHIEHLFALLQLAHYHFLEKVAIHCILDGRDVEPQSAKKYLRQLDKFLEKNNTGTVSTVIGRAFAMDKESNISKEKKAYDMLTKGKGILIRDPMEAVNSAYRKKLSDEYVEPTVINQGGLIKENDAVVFFNFRSDRANPLVKALISKKFKKFKVKKLNLKFVTLSEYDKGLPIESAFPKQVLKNTLSEFLSSKKLRQAKIAESEKFRHVTYYFNNEKEKPWPKEEWIHVKSNFVDRYDKKPEMAALKVTNAVLKALKKNTNFVLVNFANLDVVAHTGNLDAAIKAAEVVDKNLGKIVKFVERKKGILVLTADHGNAECMLDRFERPVPAHSENPVPLIVTKKGIKLRSGSLADVAPTIIKLLGFKPPKEMKGKILIKR